MKLGFYLFILFLLVIAFSQWVLDPNRQEKELEVESITELREPDKDNSDNRSSQANLAQQKILDYFQKKNFQKALELLRIASEDNSNPKLKNWADRQMPRVLVSAGWALYHQKKCTEAKQLFEESLKYQKEPLAFKGLGACYYLEKDFWTASNYLWRFIDRGFDFDGLILTLETLESLGQFEDAWLLLNDSIAKQSLNDEQMKSLEKRLSILNEKVKEAESQAQLEGQYAIVHYRANDHQSLGLWALDIIDQAVADLTEYLDMLAPSKQVEVFLYSVEGFQKINHGPGWAQGLYDGRVRIPVPKKLSERNKHILGNTLRHEISHALMNEMLSGRKVPTWFQEGGAQYSECLPNCRTFKFPVKKGRFLPQTVFEGRFVNLNQQEAKIAYIQSLYLLKSLIYLTGHDSVGRILIHQAKTSSNQIFSLQPTDLNFSDLYRKTSQFWLEGKKF